MAKIDFEERVIKTVTFSEMGMGVIGVVVDPYGDYNNTLVMKCNDGGSGIVVQLDGGDLWSTFNNNPLQVRILGKDEVVEVSNE